MQTFDSGRYVRLFTKVFGLMGVALLALAVMLVPSMSDASAQGGAEPVEFSVDHGFYSSAQSVALSTATPNAIIRYTTNGTAPTATNGTRYTSPINVNGTTVLRAVAIVGGASSDVTTSTYFFASDILTQSANPSGFPSGSVNGQVYNFGMDPDIVNGNQAAVIDALTAIPSVSVVSDPAGLFDSSTGIYSNPIQDGRDWERPASIEIIDPTGGEEGFSIEAGLRIRGGFSRSTSNPKHSFRVFFRNEYGGDLDYPLFGNDGASSFDKIDFRTAQNYSWSFNGHQSSANRNTFLREIFARDTLAELGNASTRSNYYHLYLNGHYWGLYQSQERISKEYAESYFGGDKDDYDVLKHDRDLGYRYNATDGDDAAWRALWPLIQDQQVTNAELAQLEGLVDFDSLIDVQLIYGYTAEIDGSPSWFLRDDNGVRNARGNNWYAVRNRLGEGEAGKWTFFVWDAEHSLGGREQDPQQDRTGPFPVDVTTYSIDYLNPAWIHQALMSNANYEAQFEARANQVLRGNGALTPAQNQARWDAREATVAPVILAESARWGDARRSVPLTTADWAGAVAWVENNWFPSRTATYLNQLGLPANINNDPPTVNSPGSRSSLVATDVVVNVTGNDPENGALTWSATGLPVGLSINESTGRISGNALEAGTFAITVTATDPLGLADSASFNWTMNVPSPPSPVILNEWNAVDKDSFLKNGGSDTFFGTVAGNGGDWFEIVVTQDHVDLRGWTLQILDEDNDQLVLETTDAFTFNQSSKLADVRAGTIITVAEDVADDASYDPAGGDWTMNFQANSDDEGGFFTSGSQSNFDTNHENWQLIIRDAADNPVFGPAGEGVGASGVSDTEVGELEVDPSSAITPLSLYDDGNDSTFGSANGFDGGFQDLDAIRPNVGGNDAQEPDSAVQSPQPRELLTDSAVVVTGTATDNVGVGAVQVAVRNQTTGQWLRADGTLGVKQFTNADLASPGASTTNWSFAVDLADGDWAIQVRAEDTSDNRETTRPWVVFEVKDGPGGPADTVEPDSSVTSPDGGGVVDTAAAVTGTATDNVGVAAVQVAVRDRATGQWLRADGTYGAKQSLDTTLASPGAASTDWLFTADLAPGQYSIQVRAEDTSGNRETTRPWVNFEVKSGQGDTVEPDSSVTSPDRGGVVDTAAAVTGTATDNVGVAAVQVAVRDRATGQWLRADGTYGAKQSLDTTVASPGAASTNWLFTADLAPGQYSIQVRAEDTSGNRETTRPWVNFSVVAGGAAGLQPDPAQPVNLANRLANPSFEETAVANNTFGIAAAPGWTTSADGQLEFWGQGFEGITAADGRQLAELNVSAPESINQTVTVEPGATFAWSIDHRGRIDVDSIEIFIDGQSQGVFSADVGAWTTHSGSYVATGTEVVFGVVAIDAGGSANLIDNASFARVS